MLSQYIKIIDFEEKYTKYFAALNFHWLEKYFYIEEYDNEVLNNPVKHIISKGGYIFLAKCKEDIVGTAALINRGDNEFELSKMAVEEGFQGIGVGKMLMDKAISLSREKKFKRLFLDSNTKLDTAIGLYLSYGFSEIPVPDSTPYARCNIRMEFPL